MLNRFSKDTGSVDDVMPITMLDVIERILQITSVIIQIITINWWMFGPIFVAAYLIFKITGVYFSTTQALKRLEGNGKRQIYSTNLFHIHFIFMNFFFFFLSPIAKSPTFSLVNSTLSGLSTIRSCKAQKIVCRDFDEHQDITSAVYYLCLVTTTAYGMWLDLIAWVVLAFMVYTFIPLKSGEMMGGDVGLALTQFLIICTSVQYLMRQFADLIFHMTAVERMFEYTKLEQEGSYEMDVNNELPCDNWPDDGEIKFENVNLRYSSEDQPVLKDLNFTVSPNMKVGIR